MFNWKMLGIAGVLFAISGVRYFNGVIWAWGWGVGFAFLLYGLLSNNDE